MNPDTTEQLNICFGRNPHEALEVYSSEMVFDHLFVSHWFDLVKNAHVDILDNLIAVGVARGKGSEHSMWQLIASGVAQHQSVEALEKYGHHLPLGPYLRECIAPFNEDFFKILPQYVSVAVVRSARNDVAEYFDMVQQKERLLNITKSSGGSLKKKM